MCCLPPAAATAATNPAADAACCLLSGPAAAGCWLVAASACGLLSPAAAATSDCGQGLLVAMRHLAATCAGSLDAASWPLLLQVWLRAAGCWLLLPLLALTSIQCLTSFLRGIVFWQSPIVFQQKPEKPHCHEMP